MHVGQSVGAPTYRIETARLPSRPTLVVRDNVAPTELGEFLGTAFGHVAAVIVEDGMFIGGAPFARFRELDDDSWDVEAGYPVNGMVLGQNDVMASRLPGGPVVRTVHVGPYTDTTKAVQALVEWAEEHELEPIGETWEIYLESPEATQPMTEVVLPIRDRHSVAAHTAPTAPPSQRRGTVHEQLRTRRQGGRHHGRGFRHRPGVRPHHGALGRRHLDLGP